MKFERDPHGHPRRNEFEELTRQEETAGLYEHTSTIGFKLNWQRLLDTKGLVIEGHRLRRRETVAGHQPQPETEPTPIIERHKTALTRYELSKPVKTLFQYGAQRTDDRLDPDQRPARSGRAAHPVEGPV
jgi:hypothetical protein